MAVMGSVIQWFFACVNSTVRANLACAIRVYFGKINVSLAADVSQNLNELPKASIKTILGKHSTGYGFEIKVLSKDNPGLIT